MILNTLTVTLLSLLLLLLELAYDHREYGSYRYDPCYMQEAVQTLLRLSLCIAIMIDTAPPPHLKSCHRHPLDPG